MRYLIAVMFIGVMGSLLTRPPSKISDPSASTHIVPAVAELSDEGVTGMPAAERNLDGAIRLQRELGRPFLRRRGAQRHDGDDARRHRRQRNRLVA